MAEDIGAHTEEDSLAEGNPAVGSLAADNPAVDTPPADNLIITRSKQFNEPKSSA